MSAPRDILEPAKKAAIGSDELREIDKDISQISAQEFLTALDASGLGASSLQLLPEKKKLELYLEPEWTRAIKVKDLVRVITAEKKKVELELPLDLGARVQPDPRFGRNGGLAYQSQPQSRAYASGGGAGYPTPDGDDVGPPWVEMRKTMLDDMYSKYVRPALNAHLATLEQAVRGIHQRIEQLEKKLG